MPRDTRYGVVVLAAVTIMAVLTGRQPLSAQGGGFRDMSSRERAVWFDGLGPALSRPAAPEPQAPTSNPPGASKTVLLPPGLLSQGEWHQSRGGIKWSIDRDGFVVLEDGQRPMGSRLFARTCFMRYGKSFQRAAHSHGRGLGVGHLVATAVTESGCSEERAMSSVDGLSTGIMQVTGNTCRSLLRGLGRSDLSKNDCLMQMADDPDFSVELAAAYITQPRQVEITGMNPPKVAAAYNAGGVYFDSRNPWRMRSTGNHIDRFVSAYNAYVAWLRDEGQDLEAVRKRRGAAGGHVRFMRGGSLPKAVDSPAALDALASRAHEGDTVFVGDWDTKSGDFYVFIDGVWRGSLQE